MGPTTDTQAPTDVPVPRGVASAPSAENTAPPNTAPPNTATPLAVHLAGVVVVSSVVAVDPGGSRPFELAKFCAVALTVVVAWTTLAFTTRSRLPRWFRVIGGSLVAVLVVAAIAGRDPIYAWTGTPERQLGVATWLLFAAACGVGTVLNTSSRRRVFARWTIVALGWSVAYGAVEYFGWRPVAMDTDTARVTGPYGSAAFFGAALCLLIPVTLGLASDHNETRAWRYSASIAAALGIATAAVTGTRAAWVGLTVGACLWLVVTLGRRSVPTQTRVPLQTNWRAGLPVAAGIALGLAGVAASSTVTERSAGATSRFAEWGVGWRILAAHPWLGVGPEGYRTALADGITAQYERTYGRAVTPDRAHNVLLDVGAAGGVLAAVLYVVLIAAVVWAAWRILRSPTRSPLAVGFAIAAVAYLAQQQFLFPLSTVDPVLWIVVGATVVTAWPSPLAGPSFGSRRLARLTVGALATIVLFVNGVVGLAADRAARRAIDQHDLASAERAVQLRPDVVRYRLLVVQLAPETISGQRAAVEQIAQALEVSPDDPIMAQAHADALLHLAISTHARDDVDRALTAWQTLSADDPNCYRCALALGYASALNSDTAAAKAAFTRARDLAPAGSTEAAAALQQLSAHSAPTATPVIAPTITPVIAGSIDDSISTSDTATSDTATSETGTTDAG